jgi:hypothetical protein
MLDHVLLDAGRVRPGHIASPTTNRSRALHAQAAAKLAVLCDRAGAVSGDVLGRARSAAGRRGSGVCTQPQITKGHQRQDTLHAGRILTSEPQLISQSVEQWNYRSDDRQARLMSDRPVASLTARSRGQLQANQVTGQPVDQSTDQLTQAHFGAHTGLAGLGSSAAALLRGAGFLLQFFRSAQ